jgi:hypothetical protein
MVSGLDAMRKTIREEEPLRPSTKLSQTLVGTDEGTEELEMQTKHSTTEGRHDGLLNSLFNPAFHRSQQKQKDSI